MSVTVIATGFGPQVGAAPGAAYERPAGDGPEPEGTPFERPPSFDSGDLDIPRFIRQTDE